MSETHVEIFKHVYLIGIFLASWTALSLLLRKKSNKQANQFFALFLIVMMMPLTLAYSYLSEFNLPGLATKLIIKFALMYGPCMYIFSRLILNYKVTLKNSLIHFSPFIIISLLLISNLYQESTIIGIAIIIQMIIYLLITAYMAITHWRHLSALWLNYRNTSQYWLCYIVLALILLTLMDIYVIQEIIQTGTIDGFTWHTLMSFIAVYIVVIACFSLLQPHIFYSEVENTDNSTTSLVNTLKVKQTSEKNTQLKELTQSAAQDLSEQLDSLIQKEKPYLRNDLSLKQLAETLHVSTHQLSELLNSYLNTSFYEYINNARIKSAINYLQDETCQLSILDIAYQSGFNNKNTFYKTFKSYTQLTPSEYRKISNTEQTSLTQNKAV